MEARHGEERDGFGTVDLVRVVIFTICFACLGLSAALLALPPTAPLSDALIEFNRPRLAELAAHVDDGGTGVIMIGDSRLRYATPLAPILNERLSETAGLDVHALRLVNDWGTFEDFAALTDEMLAARPAMVVFQEEFQVKDRTVAVALPARRDYVLWKTLGVGPWNLGNREHAEIQVEQSCATLELDTTVEAWRARLATEIDFVENGKNAALVDAFADELRAAGTDVVFLKIPSTTIAVEGLPQVENPRLDGRLVPPAELVIPDSDFCDLTHMTDDGRDAYSDWLIPALGERLDTQKV